MRLANRKLRLKPVIKNSHIRFPVLKNFVKYFLYPTT